MSSLDQDECSSPIHEIAQSSIGSSTRKFSARNASLFLVIFGVSAMPIISLLSISPFYLVMVMCSSFIFVARFTQSSTFAIKKYHVLWVATFFLLPMASVIWSRYPDATTTRAIWPAYCLIIYFLTLYALGNDPRRLVRKISTIIPIVVFGTFVFAIVLYGSVRPSGGQVGSLSNQGSALAIACMPFIISSNGPFSRKALISILVLSIAFLSGGRSAAAIFLLSFPITSLLIPGGGVRKLVGFATSMFVGALAILGLLLAGGDTFYSTVERITDSQIYSIEALINPDPDASDYGRALMMAGGLQAFKDSWPVGIGFGSLAEFMKEDGPFSYVSHSLLITFTSELGILGVTSLTALFLSTLNRLRKLSDGYLKSSVAASLILILLQSIFRPPYANGLLPVLLAIVTAAAILQTCTKSSKPNLANRK